MKERNLIQLNDPNTKAHATISMSDMDCIQLMNGKIHPQHLLLAKRIKVQGNLELALRMMHLREKLVNCKSSD